MKIKLLILAYIAFPFLASSQPDLTSDFSSTTPTNILVGENFTFTFNVKNIGNMPSGSCYVNIYISHSTNFTDARLISRLALESIPASGFVNNIKYTFPLPYNTIKNSTEWIFYKIDAFNQVAEYDENNNLFYSNSTLSVGLLNGGEQNLPYPMIFIHGLDSDSKTWDKLLIRFQEWYGWSYGGELNFCLNQDANTSTAYMPNNYQNWTDISSLAPADFYRINFDVDEFGTVGGNDVQSNQSAIAKQGLAIADAIAHVLQVTGRDKVILVGHSMGGLGARDYLANWVQNDGKHHVAKLLTVGTPHGGSNASSGNMTSWFGGLDELSEAVRDLRYSYSTGYQSVYLYGGIENSTYMYGNVSPFCNVNVNCNNSVGDNIQGLNNMPMPMDLSYACIVGTGNFFSNNGDGVVENWSSDLNLYKPLNADTFILDQPGSSNDIWHSVLTEQYRGCVQGIDEATFFSQAYGIDLNKLYFGNLTVQSKITSDPVDYDDYTFTLPASVNLNIQVYNIPIHSYTVAIYNSLTATAPIYFQINNGKSYLNLNTNLSAGKYWLEFTGVADANAWQFPYAFKLGINAPTDMNEPVLNVMNASVYPNPFKEKTTLSFDLKNPENVSIKLYSTMGQLVSVIADGPMNEGKNEVEINGSELAAGIYYYTIQNSSVLKSGKIIIEK